MAFTSDQLATLEAAAASGRLRVQLGDKVIQYQTLPDLMHAIRQARADVAAAAGLRPGRALRCYLEHHRG
ncbi:hypothetical protein MARPU_05690 [Marichromatium purpuratum 984]|uniref:Uncharacterized protein n=1 Tax=Marichromatium purpuratum 984 TaxID=765910 RepID=W0E2V2_MARPU|nr:hypothetical protein [Marichromatium purpuratum]AHF03426.1 hypothetical protein MARPU_05690 [Marichromatium purpuratum 984]